MKKSYMIDSFEIALIIALYCNDRGGQYHFCYYIYSHNDLVILLLIF